MNSHTCYAIGGLGMIFAVLGGMAALGLGDEQPAIVVATEVAAVAMPAIVFVGCALLVAVGSILDRLPPPLPRPPQDLPIELRPRPVKPIKEPDLPPPNCDLR